MQNSHVNNVAESLQNGFPKEPPMQSLEVLARRLRELKDSDHAFAGVSFSSHVEQMIAHRHAVAVG